MTVVIRPATSSDIPACDTIARQYPAELAFVRRASLQRGVDAGSLLVAEQGGQVVGFVLFHARRDGWRTIYDMAVHQDFVGQGIGRKLLYSVPTPVRLKCTVDNIRANRFYQAAGMTLAGREDGRKRALNIWEMRSTPGKTKRQKLPGFDVQPEYTCPLCGQVATLFGQYSPLMDWGVCRECSIKHPYPDDLFVPSTRRNRDKEPLMIDPNAPAEKRELRVVLEEMLRCAVDPSRLERPVVKFNLSGLELRNPVRRSKVHKYQKMHAQAKKSLRYTQMALPTCKRCGCGHNRLYEMRPGQFDYWSHCQRCEDEMAVESFWRHPAIFGGDDFETIMDRVQRSHPELFERGVLPGYWVTLMLREL